ncbi:diguanylate cyclase (GGDEF)-like protein [Salsuginibacillus halophilus]|uniref:Diguanylate cyclase (GGDEF)-like protein n=1 Tax=Salsuginibacillus halophilus TaxID=517424 RepID=A0A2P8HKW3_9BACI|nr:diguanylate cyclase [Salsuginibacillus halophilus]PSL46857.1 diguanylate cyclase (GGDEF)-like protein [Salsuginibacillus halophilus]
MNEIQSQRVIDYIHHKLREWNGRSAIRACELQDFLNKVANEAEEIDDAELLQRVHDYSNTLSKQGASIYPSEQWRSIIKELLPLVEGETLTNIPAEPLTGDALEAIKPASETSFILIINHDVDYLTEKKAIFEQEGYQVVAAATAEQGRTLFDNVQPSLVFIDQDLPGEDGFQVLRSLRLAAEKLNVPLIMVANTLTEENQIAAYEAGAFDILAKRISSKLLRTIAANRLAHKEATDREVLVDSLTGAYNRRHLEAVLEERGRLFASDGIPFTLALLDVDHFKPVNDQYGHHIGDEVLRELVRMLRQKFRAADEVFRYGGEEFAVVFPGLATEKARQFVEEVREAFAAKAFYARDGQAFQVTFSAGIKGTSAAHDYPALLLEKADKALYEAKRCGRNNVRVYDPASNFQPPATVLNILVVDDDRFMRRLLTRYFETWEPGGSFDVKFQTYESGVELLNTSWYEAGEKYVILLDGVMPVIDGFQVLEEVRSSHPSEDIIIMMLTGRQREEDIVHALKSGADDYMVKPFRVEEVAARVFRLAERVFG